MGFWKLLGCGLSISIKSLRDYLNPSTLVGVHSQTESLCYFKSSLLLRRLKSTLLKIIDAPAQRALLVGHCLHEPQFVVSPCRLWFQPLDQNVGRGNFSAFFPLMHP